jgi:hypothetical protein
MREPAPATFISRSSWFGRIFSRLPESRGVDQFHDTTGREAMPQQKEQFIQTVDVRELHELDWPILRLLTPSFVERLELRRYKHHLLASGQWDRIRAMPRRDSSGGVSPNVFDLYGVPAPQAGAVTTVDVSSALGLE